METLKPDTEHVFITGASGCVGHYLIQECLKQPHLHIHVLVRHPKKLQFSSKDFQRITIHQGDFKAIEDHKDTIHQMDYIIHSVTEWWGADQTHLVNVEKTKSFFMMTNPDRLKHIIYFSTASLLGKGNTVVKEAEQFGSDYIRSKYHAYHMIKTLPIADRITTVFPTMVFGGDSLFPQSHITKGVSQAFHYLKWIRYIHVDGAFHFIHAADIATLAVHFMQTPPKNRDVVLGNQAISVKDTIHVLYTAFKIPPLFRIHVTYKTILRLAKVFRIKIGPWERYCIDNPYMVFDTVCPSDVNLDTRFPSLERVIEDIKTFQ